MIGCPRGSSHFTRPPETGRTGTSPIPTFHSSLADWRKAEVMLPMPLQALTVFKTAPARLSGSPSRLANTPSGIRTRTCRLLRPVPLPLGYRSNADDSQDGRPARLQRTHTTKWSGRLDLNQRSPVSKTGEDSRLLHVLLEEWNDERLLRSASSWMTSITPFHSSITEGTGLEPDAFQHRRVSSACPEPVRVYLPSGGSGGNRTPKAKRHRVYNPARFHLRDYQPRFGGEHWIRTRCFAASAGFQPAPGTLPGLLS